MYNHGRALRFREGRVPVDLEKSVTFDTQNVTTLFDGDLWPLRSGFQDDGSRTRRRSDGHQVGARRSPTRRLSHDNVTDLLDETSLSLVPGEGAQLLFGRGGQRIQDQNAEDREQGKNQMRTHCVPQSSLRSLWNKESISYF